MSQKLSVDDLYSLEDYAARRAEFRKQVMAHKKHRTVELGRHARLLFEDGMTIQYQVQEMLRAERIFEQAEIQDELDAYNPLVPDGRNLKATLMLEYTDVEERRSALAGLVGVEDRTWVQVEGFERVYAIADEDMDRETEEKTSSVHFLRFELSDDMVGALREGNAMAVGIDHENYAETVSLTQKTLAALVKDFD